MPFSPISVKAQSPTDASYIENEYSDYSFDNCNKFNKYLESISIDIMDENDVRYLAKNYLQIYFDAIAAKKMTLITNDILLGDYEASELREFVEASFPDLLEEFDEVFYTISIKWISDKSLDSANDGTHQVISRDALDAVSAHFPGFFITNSNGVYETQCYSDYPDIYENDLGTYESHFYHYERETNYFANVFSSNTAKSRFLDHYYKAVETYMFNETVALRELGAALHFLEDLGAPVHVGDGFEAWLVEWACLLGLAPLAIIGVYGGIMITDHQDFEQYVDSIDQISEMDIPTNIDYEYYLTADLEYLIDDVVANAYQYYDEAKSTDTQKYVAALNTIPYIKEVVAGILYRFAYNLSNNRQYNYDGVLIRNRASGLYLTADSPTFYNGTNVMLDSFKANDAQLYWMAEYVYPNGSSGLNRSSSFNMVVNTNKRFDIVNSSSLNMANLQIYDYALVPAQYYKPELISHNTGYYKITTEASNFVKVLSVADTIPVVGTNVYQYTYSANSYNQWYFDLLNTLNVNWQTNNFNAAYIHKGQYVYYKLNITTPGYYCVETKSFYDTYFNLYSSSFAEIGSGSTYDNAGENNNAKIFTYFSSGTYYVRMRMYSSTTEGRVNFIVYRSTQSTPTNVYQNGEYTLYISSNYVRVLKFTAPTNGVFHFYTSGSLDTYLSVYDGMMIYLGANDNGLGVNASYYKVLEQGDIIYLILRYSNSSTFGSTTFHVD